MADGVDAAVERVEAAALDSRRDRVARKAAGFEIAERDDAPLARGERCDAAVGGAQGHGATVHHDAWQNNAQL